jgi:hypothetical protein
MNDLIALQHAYELVLEKSSKHLKKKIEDKVEEIDKSGAEPSKKQSKRLEELRNKLRKRKLKETSK